MSDPDFSDQAARARLRAVVPDEVREVCAVLTRAGHQAVTVGGAVRDAILGRDPGDWDVASSARPEEVQALFRRTIPTGIAHGTITVMVGRGDRRQGVEVTTFRGEGAYSDARRPDTVTFGVPLTEDLARRDLVINAIAYDPIGDAIFDPFGGREDIAARRIRAVGDPVARFTEDGLRVMRAVRFAAVLGFRLDEATEAGIEPALPSLRRVSQERVHDELGKLLAAPRPSVGLVIARRAGVLAVVLAELDGVSDEAWAATLGRVDAASDPVVRLAALLAPVVSSEAMLGEERAAAAGDAKGAAVVDAALRRLKVSNEDRERVVRSVRAFPAVRREAEVGWTDPGLRRVLAGVGRRWAADAVALWRAEGGVGAALAGRADGVLEVRHPLAVGELAIGGGELMQALGLPPGRRVGEILAALLERAIEDPAVNERGRLLEIARGL